MSRVLVALGVAIFLSACSSVRSVPAGLPDSTAVVTGISNGRASVPDEKMYGLRTPGGRVYFATHSLSIPQKEGDVVEIELARNGSARIRER